MACRRFMPFRSVPEPKRWPIVGHTHLFVPKIGTNLYIYICINDFVVFFRKASKTFVFLIPLAHRTVRLETADRSDGRLGTYVGHGVPTDIGRSDNGRGYQGGRRENHVRQRGQVPGQTRVPGLEPAQGETVWHRRINIGVRK